NEIAPEKGQDNKIAPYHELEIVPFPRCGLNEIADTKNYDGCQYKSDIRWWPVAPTPLALPNTPEAQSNQHHYQWHPQPEVGQPKLEKQSDDAVPCFLQQQGERRGRSKILWSKPEERRGELGRILSPSGMPLQYR